MRNMRLHTPSNTTLFWTLLFVSFTLDRASKLAAAILLKDPLQAGPLTLHLVHNTGAAFSLLTGHPYLLSLISIAVVAAIFTQYKNVIQGALLSSSMGLIVGGALGNLLDRLIRGRVLDFIDFGFWPAFNLADTAITIGGALLFLELWKEEKK